MRHQTINAQVLQAKQRARKLIQRFIAHAEPAHACVKLDVHVCDDARGLRRRSKCARRFKLKHNRHELITQTQLRLSGPETFET